MTDNKYMTAERIRMAKAGGMSEKDAVLVSLKRTAKEKKANQLGASISSPREDYPYSTRLDLDKDTMDKLNMSTPGVGDEVSVTAKGKVIRVSESSDEDSNSKSCCIQLTHMKIA